MNKEVNLTKRVTTAKGPRFCRVVLSNNGRVKPEYVLVDGHQERHPEGCYYIEWHEGTKRVRLSVGKDAAEAGARRLRKEAELNAKNHGIAVQDSDPKDARRSLAGAISEYLQDLKDVGRKKKTLAAYSRILLRRIGR